MSLIKDLLFGHSVAHTIFVLSAVIAIGVAIGNIKIFKISPGIAGVLFSGIIFGHFGIAFNNEILEFIREFGLILFVYTIGIQIGPAFFASFLKQGFKLNLLAAVIVCAGFITASVIFYLSGQPVPVVVGIMSGAVTNTPGLGMAQQTLLEATKGDATIVKTTGAAYALCYPFGIFGIILTMLAIKKIFAINILSEEKYFREQQAEILSAPSNYNLLISNRKLDGTSIEELHKLIKQDFIVSRLYRNNKLSAPPREEILKTGDIIHVVCSKEAIEDIALLAGDITEFDLRTIDEEFVNKQVILTNPAITGKCVSELNFFGKHSVNISRVYRSGIELVARPGLKLQFGDRISIVGNKIQVENAAHEMGNSIKALEHPNIIPIFLGITLGLIIGCIPLNVPGFSIPLKLGLPGGALLAAVILGRIGQIGQLSWYLPHSSNLVLREIGITMFLACVGLRAGEGFFKAIIKGYGLYWILLGAIISLLPIMIIGFIARFTLKMNYLTLCGLLSGSMTDPPALSFANQMAGSDAPSITYATVYASTMFMRIIAAQLFVIFFFK